MTKPTPAMLRFLREHNENGFRPRFGHYTLSTYDFVGRVRDAGFVTIIKGTWSGWPYSWESTQLTTAGREALTIGHAIARLGTHMQRRGL